MPRINSYILPFSEVAPVNRFASVNRVQFASTINATSSSTSAARLGSILIPANSYGINEVIEVKTLVSKVGTTNAATIRFYHHTLDQVSGATQFATCTYPQNIGGSPTGATPLFRRLAISVVNGTGRGTLCLQPTVSEGNDVYFGQNETGTTFTNYYSTGGLSSLTIDWSVDNYILVAGFVSSSLDYLDFKYLKINN